MAKGPCNVGQGLLQNTNPYRRERPVEHRRSHDYSIGCKQEDCPRWLRRSASAGWHILFQDGCRARMSRINWFFSRGMTLLTVRTDLSTTTGRRPLHRVRRVFSHLTGTQDNPRSPFLTTVTSTCSASVARSDQRHSSSGRAFCGPKAGGSASSTPSAHSSA